MIRCSVCGCLCDPGDTVNGVCDDCRIEEDRREATREMFAEILNSSGKQMELEFAEVI